MKDADNDDRCNACRFYSHGDKLTGYCKCNPPFIGKGGLGVWPRVYKHDWCGRFEADAGEAEERAIRKVSKLLAAEGGEP